MSAVIASSVTTIVLVGIAGSGVVLCCLVSKRKKEVKNRKGLELDMKPKQQK